MIINNFFFLQLSSNIFIRFFLFRLTNRLFNEQSSFVFNNVHLKNITTNSNYLLYITNHNTTIENTIFNNINCLGDESESSIILFNSGEINNELKLNYIKVDDNKSNGSFIKILGNSCHLSVNNSIIQNITAFGSIIKCICSEVNHSLIKKKEILNITLMKFLINIIKLLIKYL